MDGINSNNRASNTTSQASNAQPANPVNSANSASVRGTSSSYNRPDVFTTSSGKPDNKYTGGTQATNTNTSQSGGGNSANNNVGNISQPNGATSNAEPGVTINAGAANRINGGDKAPSLDDLKKCLGDGYKEEDAKNLQSALKITDGKWPTPPANPSEISAAVKSVCDKAGKGDVNEVLRVYSGVAAASFNAAGAK